MFLQFFLMFMNLLEIAEFESCYVAVVATISLRHQSECCVRCEFGPLRII